MPRSETKRATFTRAWLDRLALPAKREQWYDEKAPLGIKLEPTGTKVFFWFHAVLGKPTWKKIGTFPEIDLESARAKAREYSSKLATWQKEKYAGPNPFDDTPIGEEPTIHALVEDYITRHTMLADANSKEPRDVTSHALKLVKRAQRIRWQRDKYLQKFSKLKMRSISPTMVFNLHRDLAADCGTVQANRIATFVRTLFNWGIKAGLYHGPNPAEKFEKLEEGDGRERFLQPDELNRLNQALLEEGDSDLSDFVRLALATGMRKGNICEMAWPNINWQTETWTIPSTRTKKKKAITVDLMAPALSVLKRRLANRVEGIDWVFPSFGRSGHVEDFKKGFAKLLKRAKITDCTQHDLRRTFASYQAIANVPLQKIAKTLGHGDMGSVEIYARLNREATRGAMTSGAKMMEEMMKERVKLPA